MAKSSSVQALYELCKKTFSPSGASPSSQAIRKLSALLVRLAKLHEDTILATPCPTTVLYPKSGGNLHCFTAVTSCAVLDVLAPPYSEEAGRICTYYHDYPYSSFTTENELGANERKEDYAWLEAIDAPDSLHMRSGKYAGPPIQEESCFPGSCNVV